MRRRGVSSERRRSSCSSLYLYWKKNTVTVTKFDKINWNFDKLNWNRYFYKMCKAVYIFSTMKHLSKYCVLMIKCKALHIGLSNIDKTGSLYWIWDCILPAVIYADTSLCSVKHFTKCSGVLTWHRTEILCPLSKNLFIWSQWKFAHAMTAVLSWHVQNFIVIDSLQWASLQIITYQVRVSYGWVKCSSLLGLWCWPHLKAYTARGVSSGTPHCIMGSTYRI